jgi:hypothetical protein
MFFTETDKQHYIIMSVYYTENPVLETVRYKYKDTGNRKQKLTSLLLKSIH